MRYGKNIKYSHTLGEIVRDLKIDFGISKHKILSILYMQDKLSKKDIDLYLANLDYVKKIINQDREKYGVRSKIYNHYPYNVNFFECEEYRFLYPSPLYINYANVQSIRIYPTYRINPFRRKKRINKEREYYYYLDALSLVNFRIKFDSIIDEIKVEIIARFKKSNEDKILGSFSCSNKHGLNKFYWDYMNEHDPEVKEEKKAAYDAYREYYKTMHVLNFFNSKRKKL